MSEAVALRPYQHEAANAAWVAVCDGQNPLLVMATGTGKSPTFAEVARRWTACTTTNVLFLAHRQELLTQSHRHFRDAGVPSDRVVVRSVQSFYVPSADVPENIGLVVYDEAHHAPAPCNMRVLAKFKDARILGLTATPDRGDGLGLGRVFDLLAFRYDAEQATRDGYLSPVVRQSASSVEDLRSLVGTRRTIVFADSVEASKKMAAALGPTAAHVDGDTPRIKRVRILSDFADGRLQFLTNCDLVSEGFDVPACEVAAVMCNTKSRARLAQRIGRAMRPAKGKVSCLLVQLPDAVELGLIPPAECLADSRQPVKADGRVTKVTKGRTGTVRRTFGDRARSFMSGTAKFLRWMWR